MSPLAPGPDAADQRRWDELASTISEISRRPKELIRPETRLVEDLNLDSLAVLEIVVGMLVDFGVEELPRSLEETDWRGVTLGDLYDACVIGIARRLARTATANASAD
jgi:acyl carrier protein